MRCRLFTEYPSCSCPRVCIACSLKGHWWQGNATYVAQRQPWDLAFPFKDARVLKRGKNGASQHDLFLTSNKSKLFTRPSCRDFEQMLSILGNTILFTSKLYLCEICGIANCLSSVLEILGKEVFHHSLIWTTKSSDNNLVEVFSKTSIGVRAFKFPVTYF